MVEWPTSYDDLRGHIFRGFEPQDFKCFASEKVEIADDHVAFIQLQDLPIDKGKELIEINLREEGNEA